MATPLRRTESIVSCGSGVPAVSMMSMPASWTSQSKSEPTVAAAASSTRRVASASSGPVPSPGISVTRCVVISSLQALRGESRLSEPLLGSAGREGGDQREHGDTGGERRQEDDVELPAAHDQRSRGAWPKDESENSREGERAGDDEHAGPGLVEHRDDHSDDHAGDDEDERIGSAADRRWAGRRMRG